MQESAALHALDSRCMMEQSSTMHRWNLRFHHMKYNVVGMKVYQDETELSSTDIRKLGFKSG